MNAMLHTVRVLADPAVSPRPEHRGADELAQSWHAGPGRARDRRARPGRRADRARLAVDSERLRRRHPRRHRERHDPRRRRDPRSRRRRRRRLDRAATSTTPHSTRPSRWSAIMLGGIDGPVLPGSTVPAFAFPEQAAAVLGRAYAYGQWLETQAEAGPDPTRIGRSRGNTGRDRRDRRRWARSGRPGRTASNPPRLRHRVRAGTGRDAA